MRRLSLFFAAVALLYLSAACAPTYAPPIRGTFSGAPARLDAGRLEVAGSAGGIGLPVIGGPQLGVAIRDWVSVEGGANLAFFNGSDNWGLGYVGPRFTWAPNRQAMIHFISDLEFGVGLGAGGTRYGNGYPPTSSSASSSGSSSDGCSNCDGLRWSDRLAYGSYQGIGLGVRLDFVSLYLRGRLEESVATGIPLTLWGSAMGGVEFHIYDRGTLGASVGYMGFWNNINSENGLIYQLHATLQFDVFQPR